MATPNTIELCGNVFHLSPLTLKDLEELQNWVYTQLPDPIQIARELCKDLPEKVQTSLLENAYEDVRNGSRRLGSEEANKVLGSLSGLAQMLYLSGRKNYPHMTPDAWAEQLYNAAQRDLETVKEALGEEKGGALPDPKAPSSTGPGDAPST